MGGGIAFFGFAMAAMGCVIAFFTYRYSREKLLIEARSKDGANLAAADAAAEIERLKERVGVLERLATSEETRVSREIDRLRRDDLSPRA
jgi:hypothetical protein